jgi:hypothetical protein
MADFETGDIIRVAARMVYDSTEDVVNVYHIRYNDGGDVSFGVMSGLIQTYMDAVMATLDTELSTLMVAADLSVSNETQNTVFGAIAWGTFSQGGAAGEPTASGTTCFGYIRTRKPRVQMRKYFGVFPQAAMVDGIWDAGVTDAVGDALDYLMEEHTLSSIYDLQGVAYNRTLGTYEYGHTITVNSEPSYQRRRRRGVGS